jgi:hypothetical protein
VQIMLEALSAYEKRAFEPLAQLSPEDRAIYERAIRRLEQAGQFE